jgi:hypothetical protein
MAILTKLEQPIRIISLKDMNLNIKDIINISNYEEYAWDKYLLRQNKIYFLKEKLKFACLEISNTFWNSYYIGNIKDIELKFLYNKLSTNDLLHFNNIIPTRKRLISEFNIIKINNNWITERVETNEFTQVNGLVNIKDKQDYRLSKRVFKELPKYTEGEYLKIFLIYIANILNINLDNKIKQLNIIVHHTIIYTNNSIVATNSPEGIHQDGMDYIVSALVIERNNIKGGESIVYGSDSKTEILKITLDNGLGILQPDKNTELWHTVTPIQQENESKLGYRASIGFDISIVNDDNIC